MEFMVDFFLFIEYVYGFEEVEKIIKLLFSAGLGFLVGIERKRYNKPVGYRTCMIITTSATLMTLLSIYGFAAYIPEGGINDPSRLAAQILSGIGFIGAGVIMRDSTANSISGLTTAATIWILTAIGIGIGVGQFILGSFATLILIAILASKSFFEKQKQKKKKRGLIN